MPKQEANIVRAAKTKKEPPTPQPLGKYRIKQVVYYEVMAATENMARQKLENDEAVPYATRVLFVKKL